MQIYWQFLPTIRISYKDTEISIISSLIFIKISKDVNSINDYGEITKCGICRHFFSEAGGILSTKALRDNYPSVRVLIPD